MAVNGILKGFCQKFKKNENQAEDIYRIATSEKQTLGVFLNLYRKYVQEYMTGGTTIIHCAAGVSRSAAFCIAYLIKYCGMTMNKAYRHVAKCRPCINPNHGFISQLLEFEGKYREE